VIDSSSEPASCIGLLAVVGHDAGRDEPAYCCADGVLVHAQVLSHIAHIAERDSDAAVVEVRVEGQVL
jgi:hypothetical protein